MERAFEIQRVRADHGLHRTVKIGDLIIAAAAAEHAGLMVLHYDHEVPTPRLYEAMDCHCLN